MKNQKWKNFGFISILIVMVLTIGIYLYGSKSSTPNLEPIKNSANKIKLSVGYLIDSYPISMGNNHVSGIGIDIFNLIAKNNKWTLKYIPFKSKSEGLKLIEQHKVSALIGPFDTSTKLNKSLEYSLPYFIEDEAVYVKTGEITFSLMLKELLNPALLSIMAITFIIYVLLTFLLWIFDTENPERAKDDHTGRFSFFAWRIFMMYIRDFTYKNPQSISGKVIVLLILLSAFFFITAVTANITASIVNIKQHGEVGIHHKTQFLGKRVGVLQSNLHRVQKLILDTKLEIYQNNKELFKALANDVIDVAVAEKSKGDAYLAANKNLKIKPSSLVLSSKVYAFVIPKNFGPISMGSLFSEQINQQLLQSRKNNRLKTICIKYIKLFSYNCI